MLLDLVVLVVLARGLHPVSFPNLEVKPFCADGTATGGLWESRALPTVFLWWGCLVLLWGRRPHHIFCDCGVGCVCVEGVPLADKTGVPGCVLGLGPLHAFRRQTSLS